jgi:hypothetical protein
LIVNKVKNNYKTLFNSAEKIAFASCAPLSFAKNPRPKKTNSNRFLYFIEIYLKSIMSILYSLVARETTVLTKYGPKAGNFAKVVDEILPGIQTDGNHKFIYSHGAFLFYYICENKLIYMCITDKVINT